MKKIIFITLLIFWVFAIPTLAQNQVHGWSLYNDFPLWPASIDTAVLSPSNEVYTNFPIIPGYNNQNSLKVDIEYRGTGWIFITCVLPKPITMPLNCSFMVRSENNPSIRISPILKHNGDWYINAIFSYTNYGNNWYVIENSQWYKEPGSTPFPADSATIDTCILYIYGLNHQDATVIIDTWYFLNFGGDPILFCGFGDVLSGLEIINEPPNTYTLSQNYPNPFNPGTKINFTISKQSFVNLTIYNTLGQKVTTLVKEELIAGSYEYSFNATNLPSGNYFYTLTTDGYTQTKKMTLLK